MIELRLRPFKYPDPTADNGDQTYQGILMADGTWRVLQYREMKYDLLPNSDEGFVMADWQDVEISDD